MRQCVRPLFTRYLYQQLFAGTLHTLNRVVNGCKNGQALEEIHDEQAAEVLSASGLVTVREWDITDENGWTLVGSKPVSASKMWVKSHFTCGTVTAKY